MRPAEATPGDPVRGVAVVCDAGGRVREVRATTSMLTRPPGVGSLVGEMLSADGEDKLGGFLRALTEDGTAFDWTLNVDTLAGATPFAFSGMRAGSELLVLASPMNAEEDRALDRFVAMNSELVNSVRNLRQEMTLSDRVLDDVIQRGDSLAELHRDLMDDNSELAATMKLLSAILETTPNIVYVFDLKKRQFAYANARLAHLLGSIAGDQMGLSDLVSSGETFELPDTGRGELSADEQAIFEREHAVEAADGTKRILFCREMVFSRDEEGTPVEVLGIAMDVTESRVIEEQARENAESYRRQFSENSAVMLLIDPVGGQIVEANAAASRFYGHTHEQLLGMRISDISQLSEDEVQKAMSSVKAESGSRFEFRHALADGSIRDVDVSASRILFEGRPLLHSIIHDITDRKHLEAELERFASTDSLTRTANRRTFIERGTHELRRADRSGRPLSLVMMDVDDLKRINDTWGHAAGDAALVILADTCRASIRDTDLLARLGGDEFVMLLPETDCSKAIEIVERVMLLLGEQSLMVGTEHLTVTACAGIACATGRGTSLDDLLASADRALYSAKVAEPGCIRVAAASE